MNKLEKRNFLFSFCEVKGDDVEGLINIELSPGEVRNIQTLVEFSVPLLLGWHCIYNPSVVKGQ
jgi:hypothetical protein